MIDVTFSLDTTAVATTPDPPPPTNSTSGTCVVGSLNPPPAPLPAPDANIFVLSFASTTISPIDVLTSPPSYPVISPNPTLAYGNSPLLVPPTPEAATLLNVI